MTMTTVVEKYLENNYKRFEEICEKMFSWKRGCKVDPRTEQGLAFIQNYFNLYVEVFGECPKAHIHYEYGDKKVEVTYISVASNIENAHDYYGRIRYHIDRPEYRKWYWRSDNDFPCSVIKGGVFIKGKFTVISSNL